MHPLNQIFLPCFSLPNCYAAEFKEHLKVIDNGVPLEHLVSCLSFVQLKQGIGSVKYLSWVVDKDNDESHEGKFTISIINLNYKRNIY